MLGSWHGPHTTDFQLEDIIDLILTVKPRAYSTEASNPRHAHEWQVWENVKLPAGTGGQRNDLNAMTKVLLSDQGSRLDALPQWGMHLSIPQRSSAPVLDSGRGRGPRRAP